MIVPHPNSPYFPEVREHTLGQLADVGYMQAAVEHVITNEIPGAIVECGIYRGGMLKVAQLALADLGAKRPVWGYDTFTGMTETGPNDNGGGVKVGDLAASEADVREYLGPKVKLVVGDVRQTLPDKAPAAVAVLRLDVDWYESTLACLRALYPRLRPGGVLLIDDYPFWSGCVKAVDEYLGPDAALLQRTGTGSGMVKP